MCITRVDSTQRNLWSLNHSSEKANRLLSQHGAVLIAIRRSPPIDIYISHEQHTKAGLNECKEMLRRKGLGIMTSSPCNKRILIRAIPPLLSPHLIVCLVYTHLFASALDLIACDWSRLKGHNFVYSFSRCIQPDRQRTLSRLRHLCVPFAVEVKKVVEVRK